MPISIALNPNHCALFMKPLTDSGDLADSPAHIFPSAIGGRLKPKGILSSAANGFLNKVVDEPLITTFGPTALYIMKLSRDRGSHRGVNLQEITDQANTWFYSHDKDILEPAKPDIAVEKVDDTKYDVQFSGTEDQFRKFHASFKPDETVDELLAQAVKVSQKAETVSLGLKPLKINQFSRAATTAAHLFAAARLRVASSFWQEYIQKPFDAETMPMAPNTAFSPTAVTFREDFGPMAHRIALWNDPQSESLLGFVQVFGGIGILVKLFDDWRSPVAESYCVDPLTGNQGNPSFECPHNPKAFPRDSGEWKIDAAQLIDRFAQRTIELGISSETRVIISTNTEK